MQDEIVDVVNSGTRTVITKSQGMVKLLHGEKKVEKGVFAGRREGRKGVGTHGGAQRVN